MAEILLRLCPGANAISQPEDKERHGATWTLIKIPPLLAQHRGHCVLKLQALAHLYPHRPDRNREGWGLLIFLG